jgi:hypothetical protein
MDVTTLLTVASAISSNKLIELIDTSGVTEVVKLLAQRLLESRQKYEAAVQQDPTSPFELQRQGLLEKASSLRNTVIFKLPQQAESILPVLLDQLLQIYDARTTQDLTVIETSLDETTAYVNQYKGMLRQRRIGRYVAVLVSFFTLLVLIGLIVLGSLGGIDFQATLPVIGIPLSVIVWSAIGSFTAMLYRFNKSSDIELQDPLRWLLTRPLTGVVMGSLTFLIVKIGLLAAVPEDTNFLDSPELFWLVAFLAGFSDRFADGLLHSLVGRFGGDGKSDLVSLESPEVSSPLTSLLTERWSKIRTGIKERTDTRKKDGESAAVTATKEQDATATQPPTATQQSESAIDESVSQAAAKSP